MVERTAEPDFWNEPKEAEQFQKKLAGIKFWVTSIDKIVSGIEEIEILIEMAESEGMTEEYKVEIDAEYKEIVSHLDELEMKSMLGDEGDNLGALLKINSGAGGTESNDWSSMLLRMYT